MFLGVPIILWIIIVLTFGILIFISFKISRKITSVPLETDSKILKRVEVLMMEKSQFNNFKQGKEVKEILKSEGYSENEVVNALNDYAKIKAKNIYTPSFTILLVMLLFWNYMANFLAKFIGAIAAQLVVILLVTAYIIYLVVKFKKTRSL
jgi:hypothetical protein